MKKPSAGILVYRRVGVNFEVLLGHPGGPYWAKKDLGAWSIPKGEFENNEAPFEAAKREFTEETGSPAPNGSYIGLGEVTRDDGKRIVVWAVEGDVDLGKFQSNLFEMEWPLNSGKTQQFPEIDRIEWIALSDAPLKMHRGQDEFIKRLATKLHIDLPSYP